MQGRHNQVDDRNVIVFCHLIELSNINSNSRAETLIFDNGA